MQANIDDSNGEVLGYVMEKLFKTRVLDMSYIPIYMKKNRPGIKLEVLCNEEDMDEIKEVIFQETSTIGIRYFRANRTIMDREIIKVLTSFGDVNIKKSTYKDIVKYSPEYEDCRRIAMENKISIIEVYNDVNRVLGNRSL